MGRLEQANQSLQRSRGRSRALAIAAGLLLMVAVTGSWVQSPNIPNDFRAKTIYCEEIYVARNSLSGSQPAAAAFKGPGLSIDSDGILLTGEVQLDDITSKTRCFIRSSGLIASTTNSKDGKSDTEIARYESSAIFENNTENKRTRIDHGGVAIGKIVTLKELANNISAGLPSHFVSLTGSGLRIYDESYRSRLKIGSQTTVNTETEAETEHPANTITGWNQDGKLLFMLPSPR